jgi:hypothetical protein
MSHLADASVDAGNPTWLYRFGYRTPIGDGGLGSCHALEVAFVFDNRGGLMERFVGAGSPDSRVRAGGDPGVAPEAGSELPDGRVDRRGSVRPSPPSEPAVRGWSPASRSREIGSKKLRRW